MELLDYINSHPNWRVELAASPYNLEIKEDGEFVLFKYSMIESDLNLTICKEARGSIFTHDGNKWICVCRSLDKFGNWGESYADTAKIDWSRPVSVQEKIDGSIIRCWCYKGLWHVSTNGTIDAFKAECGDSTYGDVFYSIISKYITVREFFNHLDTHYTYWFEMVHPSYNPIVVHYDKPAIYYLGSRFMLNMNEQRQPSCIIAWCPWIRLPKIFYYSSLNEVLEACHNMGEDEEGYVVCAYSQMENGSFLRIKCKGDEYLQRHRLRGNGPLTEVRVVEMWQNDSLDDFLAYFPEHTKFVNDITHRITGLCQQAELAYNSTKGFPDRKEFALRAQSYIRPIASYLFARRDSKTENATSFFKGMRSRSLAELVDTAKKYLK